MMTRRTLLGALKCAFRDLRRELATIDWTLVIFAVELAGCRVSRQSSCRDRKNWSCEMCLCWGGFASLAWSEEVFCRFRKVRPGSRVRIVDRIRRDVMQDASLKLISQTTAHMLRAVV